MSSDTVAYFHAYPHQIAGAQRLTIALMQAMSAADGRRTLLVLPDEGPFADEARAQGIDVSIVRAGSRLCVYGRGGTIDMSAATAAQLAIYWLRLWRLFRSVAPAVVHANDQRGVLLAGPASRLAGRPLVWHAHGPHPSRRLNRVCAALADAVVAVSTDTLGRLDLSRRVRLRKASVVHNFLIGDPPGPGPPDASARPGGEGGREDDPLVVTGARLHPDKGIDVLLEAVQHLKKRLPKVRVLIAGHVQLGYEGYAEELRHLAEDLGVKENVEFLGRVDTPRRLWRTANVYVQPSRAEPFGLGLLEAMEENTAVIATAVDGMREVVEDGVTGLLVAPEDPVGLADALHRLLTDGGDAAAMSERARARVQAYFCAPRAIAQFTAIYDRLRETVDGPARVVRCGNAVTLWTVQRSQITALRARGTEIILLTEEDGWSERFRSLGIPTVEAGLSRRPSVGELARWTGTACSLLSRQRTPTIVHVSNVSHAVALRIARRAGLLRQPTRLVETFHNLFEITRPSRKATILRAALRASNPAPDASLFISRAYRDEAVDRGWVRPSRAVDVGNGIPLAPFAEAANSGPGREALRRDLGLAPDDQVSLVVARLDPQKGHDRYLEAARALRPAHPHLRHLLVGDGLQMDAVGTMVRELQLTDRVSVLGFRDDIGPLMRAADLLVLPSIEEGFGRCLVEALALGLPVVAGHGPGPDVILDGGTFGVLVDADARSLEAGIDQLLTDRALQARLRRAGPDRATRFDEAVVTGRVARVYDALGRSVAQGASLTALAMENHE